MSLKSQILHQEWRSPSLCSEGGSEVWEPLKILPVQGFWWDTELSLPPEQIRNFSLCVTLIPAQPDPGMGESPWAVLGSTPALGKNSAVARKSLSGSLEINSVFKKILFIFTHYHFHSWRKQCPFSGKMGGGAWNNPLDVGSFGITDPKPRFLPLYPQTGSCWCIPHSQPSSSSSSNWEELEARQTQHSPGCNSSGSHQERTPGVSFSTEELGM